MDKYALYSERWVLEVGSKDLGHEADALYKMVPTRGGWLPILIAYRTHNGFEKKDEGGMILSPEPMLERRSLHRDLFFSCDYTSRKDPLKFLNRVFPIKEIPQPKKFV